MFYNIGEAATPRLHPSPPLPLHLHIVLLIWSALACAASLPLSYSSVPSLPLSLRLPFAPRTLVCHFFSLISRSVLIP